MSERILAELVNGTLSRPQRQWLHATHNPAGGAVLGLLPVADANRVAEAVAAARTAFDDGRWSRLPAINRADLLLDLADQLEANLDALARAETADTGMLLSMTSQGHLPRAIAHCRYFAAECQRQGGECFAMDNAYWQIVQREPLGVVAILAPWSAPLAVATINLAAALAVGNTVVLKSSERAPLTLSLMAELIAALDFPPGVVNIIHGPADPTGKALVRNPQLDGLCFVGGTDTARDIAAQPVSAFRRTLYELGGKSPTIVLADADIDAAVDGAMLAAFASNGEVCTAGSRLLLQEDIQAAFLERFLARVRNLQVGDPCHPLSELGPMIDVAHLESIERHIALSQQEGGTLLCGGQRIPELDGPYLSPAVLSNIAPEMSLFQQEVFGPVVAVTSFSSPEQAVVMANASDYGLAATVWCADAANGLRLARQLRCGVVAVNSPVIRDMRVPFGGRGASGLGRVGGRWSLEQYSELKTVSVPLEGYILPRLGLRGKE
ncbi:MULTISPECIES: aldehyde dehydrogenase family protein [unclassified Pseudomonas]|jgi:acyl-CoA reductase-like NAD-dependent aldehyde dehydrogenase|uniref:aldehyde dehydrogenase family protein n=1 Tax=unclassified Pseudomonas TaxID=196821 RepID=UPI002160DDAC|nr:aldehyde dehydrogenase family protein [Pseudomonas sp. B21-015]UVM51204.1 aldehyde dehydrogenase family protein [Pseudomonas sp. B21-015]